MAQLITPVILCGGSGTRLWPVSREDRPKPFLPLFDGVSPLAATLARVADRALYAPPLIVANEAHRFLVAETLRTANTGGDILLEEAGRDSAPAIAAALALLAGRDPEATALILAADHLIRDTDGFRRTVLTAAPAAAAGAIVLFGIPPTEPATGFGYVCPAADEVAPGVRKVAAFVEKPDRARAERYCADGYLWNGGMFMMRAADGLAELRRLAPAVAEAAAAAIAGAARSEDFIRLGSAFLGAPKISFDYAVMEKTDRAAVVAAAFDWSDIGSWAAVWAQSPKDPSGNTVVGTVVLAEVRNSYVRSDAGAVAVAGVEDLIVVVDESGAVLVASRHQPDAVKRIADLVKAMPGKEGDAG